MQATYPNEDEARAAIAAARTWVNEHVYENDLEKEVEVNSVQSFVAAAPGGPSVPKEGSGQGQRKFARCLHSIDD